MAKYDNKFKDGPNDDIKRPMKKKKKRIFDKETGKYLGDTPAMDTKKWYKDRLGIGNKAGEGALAKRRKKTIDDQVKKAGG